MFRDELVQSDILLRSLFVSYIASLLGKIDCLRIGGGVCFFDEKLFIRTQNPQIWF